MKKSITNYLNDIIIYLSIFIVNFFCITKTMDYDLYFDLRSAEDILKYGLDMKDHMSMFDGLTYWYHHWLYDLIIYPIYNLGGVTLLFILAFLITSIMLIIIYEFLRKRINSKLVALISTLLIPLFLGSFFSPKVKVFNYLIMFIQFITIYKLYTKGGIKHSIISVILSIILVNLHFPLWILVPVFYLPYIAQMIYIYVRDKFNIRLFDKFLIVDKCANNKLFIITFVIILFSCLISPYGFLPYTFAIDANGYYDSVYIHIAEMKRTSLYEYPYITMCFIWFVLYMIFNKKMSVSNLCYLLGLGLFGLIAVRNIPYLIIYYIVILTWCTFYNIHINNNIKINNYIKSLIIIIEVVILIVGINIIGFNKYSMGSSNKNMPIKSTEYIINNLDYKNIKLYNTLVAGSYLEYNHVPVFVDQRIEVYLSEFNGKADIMVDYDNTKPETLINKYNFDYYLVHKKDKMYDYLYDNNYVIIYSENNIYYLFKNDKY